MGELNNQTLKIQKKTKKTLFFYNTQYLPLVEVWVCAHRGSRWVESQSPGQSLTAAASHPNTNSANIKQADYLKTILSISANFILIYTKCKCQILLNCHSLAKVWLVLLSRMLYFLSTSWMENMQLSTMLSLQYFGSSC